jgi:hypothetical protein
MNARKLALPLLVALACVGLALASLPAAAAPQQPSKSGGSKSSGAKPKKLRIDGLDVATKAGPLTVRVAADVKSEVHMKVNGSRVATPFEAVGKRVQEVELRAADGLRPGANKLRIEALNAGVKSVATRTVDVPARALAADAGEDADTFEHVHVQVGTPTPLGADAGGGDLNYHWRIVDGPPGAEASLSGTGAAEPVLIAKEPGTYVLQLEADPDQAGKGDDEAGKGDEEADGGGEEADDDSGNDDNDSDDNGTEPVAYDRVTVPVAPNDPPIGATLNTIGPNGGINIAGTESAQGNGGTAYVVLERTTRAVVASGRVNNDGDGMAKLAQLADTYGAGGNYMKYLMIMSGTHGIPDQQLPAFASVLKKVGTALPSEENFVALRAGLSYSIIGIPGAPAGAATTRIPGGYKDPLTGAINGYLQRNLAVDADGTPIYEYVAGEQPSFDTRAPGSTDTSNKMTIAGQSYSASLPGGATAGFHLVVLESLSLRPLINVALPTNGSGDVRKMQGETAAAIKADIEKPGGPTVFLQTIGKPKAAGPEWESIVNSVVRLGGNGLLVNALDGNNGYALVSRLGGKAPAAESSTASDPGPYTVPTYPPARLVGTLARSRTSNFVPNVFSTPTEKAPEGTVNIGLMKTTYQAPQAWPDLAPGAPAAESAAAQKFICEALNFCQAANSCPTVRECFWQKYGSDWGHKYAVLGNLNYPGDGRNFNAATFAAVKAELLQETSYVVDVKSYLTQLQEPFEKSGIRSYVDLQDIGKNVWDSVQPPPVDNSTSWVLGLFGKVAALGGFAGPPISSAAAGISAAFGLAAYLSNKAGQPILGSEIKARSSQLGSEMLDRIDLARKATTNIGMLLVSDYGKLKSAAGHVDSDWSLPTNPQSTIDSLRTASRQWFYEALVPTAYPYLIRGNTSNARNLSCPSTSNWPNQPDFFQMYATVGYEANGNPIKAIFFFTRGRGGASSPPASLGDEMFRPRGGPNPGLGIEKLQFFSPRIFNGAVIHAVNGTGSCSTAFLPNFG